MAATVGLASLTVGIVGTESLGWADPVVLTAFAVAAVAVVTLLVVETRFAPSPLVPLRLFGSRGVALGNVVVALTATCLMPMWYFLAFTMQDVLGYTAVQAGLGFLPHTLITIAVGARVAPRLMQRLDARTLVAAGAAVAAAGFWWQSAVTAGSGYLAGILGPAVLMSVGAGLLTTPLTTTVTASASAADAGAVAGVLNAAKQVGGALGLAVLVVVAAGDPADGYGRAFLAMAAVLAGTAAVALALPPGRERVQDDRVGRAAR